MVHLILTGATGLVGSAVLRSMLVDPKVTKISILSRRPVAQAQDHEKAHVLIHKDYLHYKDLEDQLADAHGCVWALGISQSDVLKDEYVTITRDYPLAFARYLAETRGEEQEPINFVYVSGEGATTQKGYFTPFFGPVKGEAEEKLIALGKEKPQLNAYNLRPAGVDASSQTEIHPFIPVLAIWKRVVFASLFPIMRYAYPSMMSPTRELGDVLVRLAYSDGKPLQGKGVVGTDGRIVSNVGFRRLAGL
jgi:hypothetical protein